MTTYNNTFSGNFIQPSTVSYNNIVLNSNITLTWPTSYQDSPDNNVMASVMTVQADAQSPIIINLGNDPLFTINGLSTIIVTLDDSSNLFVGTPISISGAVGFNGLTGFDLNITSNILRVNSNTTFQYNASNTASGSSAGGGNAVVLTYSVPFGIILPDATQVSNGTQVEFINNGDNPFFISDNGDNFLVTLNSGNVYNLTLTDNTTSAGVWVIVQAGTGTASSNASALQGLGLTTLNGRLNTDFPSKFINGNYTITNADRGSLIVWTGGVGNITLLSNSPTGFPISFNNSGGGTVTLITTDGSTIDGSASFQINPGESLEVITTSSGVTWNTLGFGKETFFAVNTLSLSIAAGGTFNLTADQSSRIVQTYTGALAGNAIVTFPAAPGQWYVWNNTSNAHTVTLQLFGVGGGFVIPQGEKLIVYSDGNNLYFTPTISTNAVFNPGNEGSPTIVFNNDTTTGFYSFGAGDFGFSSSGTLSIDLADYGVGIKAGGEIRLYDPTNSNYSGFKANVATIPNIIWTLPQIDSVSNGGVLRSNGSGSLSFSTATYPSSTTINQILYSSAANTITGLATANNGILVTSAGGVPSIGSTIPNAVQLNITQLGTITTGVWHGTAVTVPFGGTGLATLTTAYGVVCAGTTATGALQNAGTGTAGQVFTSNGAGALPTFQNSDFATAKANITDCNLLHPTVNQGINISSIDRSNAGVYNINFTTPFSGTNYQIFASTGISNATLYYVVQVIADTNSIAQVFVWQVSTLVSVLPVLADPPFFNIIVYGT